MTMVDELMATAKTLPTEKLPEFLGALEGVRATAWARLSAPAPAVPASPEPDRLIDIRQVAARLGMSTSYLYRHHDRMSCAKKVGRKLLFSSKGVEEFIRKQK